MDRHVFGQTAWPINIICYLERRADAFYHALAAWAPPRPNISTVSAPNSPARPYEHRGRCLTS